MTDPSRHWPLILGYHSINDRREDGLAVRPAEFEKQLAWLRKHGYQPATLAQLMSGRTSSGRTVVITFDDGYADNYTHAFPLLKRHGFVGTMFLVSDYVGADHVFWWDRPKVKQGQSDGPYRLVSWAQAREMADYGVEIGSHTCTHPMLTRLGRQELRIELTRSREDLERQLGVPVTSFCYPHGDLNEAVIESVQQAGYNCAVVTPTRPGIPFGRYTLRRMSIYRPNSELVFRIKLLRLVRRNYERLRRSGQGPSV